MKQIPLLLNLLFCGFTTLASCQTADAIYIRGPRWTKYPQGEGRIVFRNDACGKIEPAGKDSFTFFPSPLRTLKPFEVPVALTESSADLFNDCVYFNPLATYALHPLGERRTRELTIFSSVENSLLYINPENIAPASYRMYIDTARVKTDYADRLVADTILPRGIAPFTKTFYFRKYEVSNKEYKEFVEWVKDSVARIRLGYITPNGKIDHTRKIDWSDTIIQQKLAMYILPEERFWHRKEIDTRLLVYKFNTVPGEYGLDTIAIYPDTLSWVHDYGYAFNEPMTNMYFWHPAYADYPVVGINYWQCLAFLEWKTKQLQQQFNKEGKKYRVTCALPTDAQWDMASTALMKDGMADVFPDHYFAWSDNLWLTDLQLHSFPADGFTILEPKKDPGPSVIAVYTPRQYMKFSPYLSSTDEMIRGQNKTYGNFTEDGYFHTGPVNPGSKITGKRSVRNRTKEFRKNSARFIAHTDSSTGICYMDGNVSEWLSNDLDSCWRPVFAKHLELPQGPLYESAKVARQVENYYFNRLPIHGKLVRGSNWYDERFNLKHGKNTTGMNAKTFVDPSKAHCTLGFRYVIYVENL